ncbi:D-alanyl-D-alanine carboxypeptidase family protein [Pseudomonas jessenii]|uniref:D-alanyl-D-alanine carboxypeptidase-like protein n=1 Tax=Pseudomonas jessenii TaxID=77298 RepID=A0A370S925_PSEJE|nr:D-alanyl-D-alanine carboxypeptidase family protein [Pseudomonas jessenii]RDL16225.1 D-alanyl-D-alanine carboxypeptidase-like protein [Pseudomonas jessenii]
MFYSNELSEPFFYLRDILGVRYGCLAPSALNDVMMAVPHVANDEEIIELLPLELMDSFASFFKASKKLEVVADVNKQLDVYIGPKSSRLLECLAEHGFRASLCSAYRSSAYQALIYFSRYLEGSLFDLQGRLTVCPPGFSDHERLDGAIDVENYHELYSALAKAQDLLTVSLYQPYLVSRHFACEPWHWRIDDRGHSNKFELPRLNLTTRRTRPLHDVNFVSLAISTSSIDLPPSSHKSPVFTEGFAICGAKKCVGSLLDSSSDGLSDSFLIVGKDWDAHYITVSCGSTPAYNGQIIEQDIGHNIFELKPYSGERSTFITAKATIDGQLFREIDIQNALEEKSAISNGESYYLLRHSCLDYVLSERESCLLPAMFGRPISLFEREVDKPFICISEYLSWIESFSPSVPPQNISKTGKIIPSDLSHARLAFTLLELDALRGVDFKLPSQLQSIENLVLSWLDQKLGKLAIKELKWEEVLEIVSTLIFMSRIAIARNNQQNLWLLISRLDSFLESCRCGWNIDLTRNIIFIGHLCQLSIELLTSKFSSMFASSQISEWLSETELFEFSLEIEDNLAFASAKAKILRYLSCHSLVEPTKEAAVKTARCEILKLIKKQSSPVPLEDGAFSGCENFYTTLGLEAILDYMEFLQLSRAEINRLGNRVLSGINFLRALQFATGSNFLKGPLPGVEGAFSFSLVDHHSRIDYGAHAMNVCRRYISISRRQ